MIAGFCADSAVVAQAQPRRGAGRQVLHHDVGLLEHQALEHLGALRDA